MGIATDLDGHRNDEKAKAARSTRLEDCIPKRRTSTSDFDSGEAPYSVVFDGLTRGHAASTHVSKMVEKGDIINPTKKHFLEAWASMLKPLWPLFERIFIGFDIKKFVPKSKSPEQRKRREVMTGSHSTSKRPKPWGKRPLTETEKMRWRNGEFFPWEKIRRTGDIYAEAIQEIVMYFLEEYRIPNHAKMKQAELRVWGDVNNPDKIFIRNREGDVIDPVIRTPVGEGDMMVVAMAQEMAPCVVWSNDLDVELSLVLRHTYDPILSDKIIHFRSKKNLGAIIKTPPTVPTGRWSVYDLPFLHIRSVVEDCYEQWPGIDGALTCAFFNIVGGSDYVQKGWLKKMTMKMVFRHWKTNPCVIVERFSTPDGEKVYVHEDAFYKLLQDAKAALRPSAVFDPLTVRATCARARWCLLYWILTPVAPDQVPDCLAQIDGVSVHGWELETDNVTHESYVVPAKHVVEPSPRPQLFSSQ